MMGQKPQCDSLLGSPQARCTRDATYFYLLGSSAICRCFPHSFPILDDSIWKLVTLDEYFVHIVMSS
jgi:hypothetical protein